MRLKDIRIGTRLGIGFGILVVLMVGLVVAGIQATHGMNRKLTQIVKTNNAKIQAAYSFQTGTRRASIYMLGALATKDDALRQQCLDALAESRTEYASWLEKLDKIEDTKEGREIISNIKQDAANAKGRGGGVMDLVKAGKNDEAVSAYLTKALAGSRESHDLVRNLISFQQEDIARRYAEAESSYHWSFTFLIVVGCIVVGLAIAMTLVLTRSIIEPIRHSISTARMLEAGNLTVDATVDRKDELGDQAGALKGMVEKWRDIIGQVKQASDNVASASTEMSAGAEQMARGADEQAKRSHQVATASQEMSQTVLDISRNASSMATTAASASSTAKEGGRIVEESVKGSREIAQTVQESVDHITSLADLSHRIGEIIGIINEIADQTNLLALNAAIEAARAGEHGRGFAVVADEVRKLAERTTGATSEVSGIIKEIQHKVGGAVSSIQNVSSKVDRGVELSTKAGSELRNIVAGVDDLQAMVQQIASAIEEMSATSEQISQDIESISNVSTDTSQSSGEVSRASHELSKLGVDLQRIAQQFQV